MIMNQFYFYQVGSVTGEVRSSREIRPVEKEISPFEHEKCEKKKMEGLGRWGTRSEGRALGHLGLGNDFLL